MVAVPEGFTRPVCFLCVDKETAEGVIREPKATGFFVGFPLEGVPNTRIDYLVTARHCIEEARPYGTLFARFNRINGGFVEVPTKPDDWLLHDRADVATMMMTPKALPSGMKASDFETSSLALSTFVGPGPDYMFRGDVPLLGEIELCPQVGNEIYFVGLFTEHYGEERNWPIARFGHSSRMPNEIEVEHGGTRSKITAYLAEFHSLGGHSGSPVFFFYPWVYGQQEVGTDGNLKSSLFDFVHISGFLGLVSGHYGIEERAKTLGDVGEVQMQLNSGVAIVTPATAVLELLRREDLVEHRRLLREQIEARKPVPTMDFAEARNFSKGDFDEGLRRLSQR
jgi:hypothetical protein